MTTKKTNEIHVSPIDLAYVDEEDLQTKEREEELMEYYEMGYAPSSFSKPAVRAEYEAFLKKNNYAIPE
jgi:hypothetical protein